MELSGRVKYAYFSTLLTLLFSIIHSTLGDVGGWRIVRRSWCLTMMMLSQPLSPALARLISRYGANLGHDATAQKQMNRAANVMTI